MKQHGESKTIKIQSGGKTYEDLSNDLTIYTNQLLQSNINNTQYQLNCMSSVIYYTKAMIFSNWVYDNLYNTKDKEGSYNVLENELVEISGLSYSSINGSENVIYSFDSNKSVFNTDGSNQTGTEIATDSTFYNHKLNVIRNSIQYNLNLAMTTYNSQSSGKSTYEMPVIQNEEWEQILTNVTFVAFMQGYSCGLKTYNNYMVVSSTNNELTVDPDNIYYVAKEEYSNEESEYHKIDCPELINEDTNGSGFTEYISFTSKEVKYDKIQNRDDKTTYTYDHKNLACYTCINDGNYNGFGYEVKEVDSETGKINIQVNGFDILTTNLKKAYYLAVGKERNDIYKMNAVDNSEGYEVIYDSNSNPSIDKESALPISEIESIEIVIGTIHALNSEGLRYNYTICNQPVDVDIPQIDTNDDDFKTITINLDSSNTTLNDSSNINISYNKINIGDRANTLYAEISNDGTTIYTGNDKTAGLNSAEQKNISRQAFKDAIKYIRVIYK